MTPLEAFREAARRIQEDTRYDPAPAVLYVSSAKYQWLIDQGYIGPDGAVTEKGWENFGRVTFLDAC